MKAGVTLLKLWRVTGTDHNGGVNYTFRNRIDGVLTSAVPTRVTQFAEPLRFSERVNYNLGLYAQDQWRIRRVTLNLGVRADFLNTQVDAQRLPAGPLIGERDFAEINDVPNWKDVAPRLGVAYDPRGNGKTAIKATLGRYVVGESYMIARALGRQRTNNCSVVEDRSVVFTATSSRTTPFCDVCPPMQPNVKIQAVYPLPWWKIEAAATFQSLAGPQLLAQQDTLNAEIRPSLGRNLSSCRTVTCEEGTVLLDLVPPGTIYGDRINQVDLRVGRTIRAGRFSVRPAVSVYNLLNANPVLQYNNRYNAGWPAPNTILMARFVDFGLQLDF